MRCATARSSLDSRLRGNDERCVRAQGARLPGPAAGRTMDIFPMHV